MSIHRRHIGLAGAAAIVGATMAADRPAQAQAAEERAVAQAVDALSKAMIDVDRARLQALTSDKLSYGHSAGRIENQAQFIDYLASRASAFKSITHGDQTISVVDNNAVVRHLLIGETVNPAGQTTAVRVGVMQVWSKQGNDWKLLARQAYRI